jgi:hypothetical protein
MVLEKHSPLTPFFATTIMKLTEFGIIDVITKRFHYKYNCPMDQKKGKSLGMEKFAPLFTIYLAGCIMSLTILIVEIFFEKLRLWPQNVSGHLSEVEVSFQNNENHHSAAVRLNTIKSNIKSNENFVANQTCLACGAKQFKSDPTPQK